MNQAREQRKYSRKSLNHALAISSFGISQVKDISEGGCSVNSLSRSAGQDDVLTFSIMDSNGLFLRDLTAQVVWKSTKAAEDSTTNVMCVTGVKFVDLTTVQETLLQQMLSSSVYH